MKPPKDVLGLGQYLVRELGFEDGVDTLGRWMAHHVAELMDRADHGSTASERSKAYKDATETILKIWDHRTSLPGNTYPLAPYTEILKTIELLKPNDNPFWYAFSQGKEKRQHLAASLFDSFLRLIIALLLMEVPLRQRTATADRTATDALTEAEQRVLTAILQWGDLFNLVSQPRQKARKGHEKGAGKEVGLEEASIELIGKLASTLAELESEIKKMADDRLQGGKG